MEMYFVLNIGTCLQQHLLCQNNLQNMLMNSRLKLQIVTFQNFGKKTSKHVAGVAKCATKFVYRRRGKRKEKDVYRRNEVKNL